MNLITQTEREASEIADAIRLTVSERIYTEERIQAGLEFRKDVAAAIQNATSGDKRKWYRSLNVSITLNDRKATVKCLIPIKEGVFDFNTF